MDTKNKKSLFERFSDRMTAFAGSSYAFICAVSIVVIWAASGPLFNFSETWQLVINTGTTIITFLKNKSENQTDSLEVRKLKGLIRRRESYAATRYIGLEDKNIHFLDMPFYETGRIKKSPIDADDIAMVAAIIEKIKPHQIFAAGDLSDPHGTHKVCLNAILNAMKQLKPNPFMNDCWLWLYSGAWHEWEIHDIDMAVPLSPEEVLLKRHAILYHQSQKDKVMFQGSDSREFWVRAEDRNKHTAKLYDDLGLAEYQAMEAFKRLDY